MITDYDPEVSSVKAERMKREVAEAAAVAGVAMNPSESECAGIRNGAVKEPSNPTYGDLLRIFKNNGNPPLGYFSEVAYLSEKIERLERIVQRVAHRVISMDGEMQRIPAKVSRLLKKKPKKKVKRGLR